MIIIQHVSRTPYENKSLNELRNRFALPGRCYVSEEVEQQEEELRVHHVQRRVRTKGAFGEHTLFTKGLPKYFQ